MCLGPFNGWSRKHDKHGIVPNGKKVEPGISEYIVQNAASRMAAMSVQMHSTRFWCYC
jgi:hypothetical protein